MYDLPPRRRISLILVKLGPAHCSQQQGEDGLKVPCAPKWNDFEFPTQNDETLSRNSLRYLSKANLTIAVN